MKKLLAIFVLVLAVSASSAFALDLKSARAQGVLGEKNDGYVSVLKSSAEASALADEVNSRRKTEYEKISKGNGQSLAVVGKVAAEEIAKKLPAGAKYQATNGSWVSK